MDDAGGEGSEGTLDRILTRRTILRALADGAAELDALTAATDYSRSTVSRAINEFDDAGVIETRSRGRKHVYRLTAFGERVLEWIDEGETLVRCRSMFAAMSPDARLPPWVLTSGNIEVTADRGVGKHEVFDQILAFISRGDRFHVVAPNLTRDETFYHLANEVVSNDLAVEMVIPDSFLNLLRERFPEEMRTMFREHDVTAYALPDEPPYGIGVTYREDDEGVLRPLETAVVCYDEHYHNASGTVVSDSPAAVAWGEERYTEYRARATKSSGDPVEHDD